MTKLFYNPNKTKSYNALFNFELGERGVGKTYSWLKECVNDYIKRDEEFIYLRRRESELETAFPSIFKPHIKNHEWDEHAISRKSHKYYLDGVLMGYGLALSTAGILKSTSFENVKTIIFDEFLLGTGFSHYLKNEVVQFLELYETVARMRDVRCVFLGNATSSSNPYFHYFNLTIGSNKEYQLFNKNTILVHYIENPVYREKKKETKFGQLIAGSRYETYAVENKWLLDQNNFIGKKPQHARYMFSILIRERVVGLWRDNKNDYVYLSEQYDPNAHRDYCIEPQDISEQTMLIKKGNFLARNLVAFFEAGRLISENQELRNLMTELIEVLS